MTLDPLLNVKLSCSRIFLKAHYNQFQAVSEVLNCACIHVEFKLIFFLYIDRHNFYSRSIQLCHCKKNLLSDWEMLFLLQWQVFISFFYWIIYSKRSKSQNLEEKEFVMNKGCAFLEVCACGLCDASWWQQTCSVLHYASESWKHGQVKVPKKRGISLDELNRVLQSIYEFHKVNKPEHHLVYCRYTECLVSLKLEHIISCFLIWYIGI